MLYSFRKKIESQRNSPVLFWRFLVWLKDLIWQVSLFRLDQNPIIKKLTYQLFGTDFTDLSVLKPIKSYAFVFVCQQGELEFQAVLLAASLKRFLKCDYELIAAVPEPVEIMGKPQDLTLEILAKMGVRIVKIYNATINQDNLTKRQFITNKFYCLKIPTPAEKLIFIDSDMLCQKNFAGDLRFSIPFNAGLAGVDDALPYQGLWQKFYNAIETEIPPARVRIDDNQTKPVVYIPPYFNSRFIAILTNLAPVLSDCWLDCFKKLEAKNLVSHNPYYIDQITLALAVHKMKIPYESLEPWLSDCFIHYQNQPAWTNLAKSLIIDYPPIADLAKINKAWDFLLK